MSKRRTTEQFIAEARAAHAADDRYDYSKVEYKDSHTKVEIICPEHGSFYQFPTNHLRPCGCPGCIGDAIRKGRGFGGEFDVARARAKHGDKYDYSNCKGGSTKTKVTIGCHEHGPFLQSPEKHYSGGGCPECGRAKVNHAHRIDTEEFIRRAKTAHGETYSYEKTQYVDSITDLLIACPTHGDFKQIPRNHLFGRGCPKCAIGSRPSKPETELFDFIKTLAPDAEQSDRTLLAGKELDIVVPSRKLAFEFNGLWWHSERMGTQLNYHQDKTDAAAASGYRLIHIFSDEWENHRAWCEAHIRNVLNVPARIIYARKCEVEQHESAVGVRQFLEENHLQGFRGGRSIVLKYDGEIVACAIVSKTIYGTVELARWCVKLGLQVVGGFSKVTKLLPAGIISYCDTSKYDGSGYEASGWTKVADGQPSYHYTDGIERVGRQHFQKHKLLARGAVGENEVDLAASEGFYRIGGCRQLKFALR